MKKFLFVLIVLSFLATTAFIPAMPKSIVCQPPALPSSFYGFVTGPTAKVGDIINVTDNNALVATTKVFAWSDMSGKRLVYTLNINAYDSCYPNRPGGKQNDQLVFRHALPVAGRGVWRTGTDVNLNLNW